MWSLKPEIWSFLVNTNWLQPGLHWLTKFVSSPGKNNTEVVERKTPETRVDALHPTCCYVWSYILDPLFPHLIDVRIGGVCKTSIPTSRNYWSGLWRWESYAGFELSIFILHTTTFHHFLKHHECLWGETIPKRVPIFPFARFVACHPSLWRQAFHPIFVYSTWNS